MDNEREIKIRRQITLSSYFDDWLKAESRKLGIPVSSLIAMALKTYIDERKALENMSNIPDWLKQVETLKNSGDK